MKIYAAKTFDIETALDTEMTNVIQLLDKSRQKKVAAIRHKDEWIRSIFAGMLLRYAFLQEGYREAEWQKAEVGYGEYGKPYIKNLSQFHYSLSHSEEWIICVAGKLPVGADVQKMRPWKMQMAKRFYSEVEYDRLVSLENTDKEMQTRLFYKMWTAKECCVKLTGRGIGAGISQYVTDEGFKHISGLEHNNFYINIYDTISDYIVCVCSEEADFPEGITTVDLHEILTIDKVEG